MSFRLYSALAVFSLICGLVIFFLLKFQFEAGSQDAQTSMPDGSFREEPLRGTPLRGAGCVVLVFDEARDDLVIRQALAQGGMDAFISESSQVLLIDDFNEFKMIPLYSFRSEIEDFDPRNDGYAEKLSSFFVRDGKRFFFLLLDELSGIKTAALKKQLVSILGDTPFSMEILGQRRPFYFIFLPLAAACACAFYLSHSRRFFVFQLPLLLVLAWCGTSAFILASILCGIGELLREPVREFYALRHYNTGKIIERLKQFKLNIILFFLFIFFLVIYSIALELSPLVLPAVCVCFFLLYFLMSKAEVKIARRNRHFLFTPVPLLTAKAITFSPFPLLMPFGIGAVFALLLPVVFPAGNPSASFTPGALYADGRDYSTLYLDAGFFVSNADYHRHLEFQRSFSFRPLNQDQIQGGYQHYYLGEDGLIEGGVGYLTGDKTVLASGISSGIPEGVTEAAPAEFPPFPLEQLMNFLVNYSMGGGSESVAYTDGLRNRSGALALKEWAPVVIILIICALDFFRPGKQLLLRGKKMKKVPVFRDKRMAA